MRSKLFEKDPHSSRFSRFIEGTNNQKGQHVHQNEEEMMRQIGKSVLALFIGCHADNLKITMSLRDILLTNFQAILEEVAILCGEKVANELVEFLYDSQSLDD